MNKNRTTIVVEGPTKAKTIGRIVGKEYDVVASYGHVYELVPKMGAVNTDDFSMNFQPIAKNKKHLDKIVSLVKKSSRLILATDPDREGEAIASHICEFLEEHNATKDLTIDRCSFYQITPKSVMEAIDSPQSLNMHLVDAQHARRAMDFLLGFSISPLMWRTIKPGTSAGRVQSPALHLIVTRENERKQFQPQEYWSIHGQSTLEKALLKFSLCQIGSEKLEKFSITNEAQATEIANTIKSDPKGIIKDVVAKTRARNPQAPFTTSTLQQEASRKINFSTTKTMGTAQELYEGISIDGTQVGLITYMRTDSVNMAKEAIDNTRDLIQSTYGDEFLSESVQVYKTKTKNAQEAHEAIRPTNFDLSPDKIKSSLSPEQYKLYNLIWCRSISSQMTPAKIATTSIFLHVGDHIFKATGSVIEHPGFLAAYNDDHALTDNPMPKVDIGQEYTLTDIEGAQHFTEPPPRYTEGSLVKALEELGIGRPSTYASIISTLKKRQYVELENKQFAPTDIADVVNKFLTNYFERYIDYQFTAQMEDALDAISRGEAVKNTLLEDFWKHLEERVTTVGQKVTRSDVSHEELDEQCPDCQKSLLLKLGKHGKFIGCSQYPECRYTRPLEGDGDKPENEIIDKKCPKCSKDLAKKHGGLGGFYGCTGYPECRHTEPLPANITEVTCPKCNTEKLIKRQSKKKKIFFGCPGYPKCKYAIWNKPLPKPCPECQWPILTEKVNKSGTTVECPECKHKVSHDTSD